MAAKKALASVVNARVGLSQLAENQFEHLRHAIGGARVVLIGEETHGTQEFYALRAEITKALIERERFSLVLCESDFPSFYKQHQFVGGGGGAQAATQTLTTSPSDEYSATQTPESPPSSPPHESASEHVQTTNGGSTMTTEQVMDKLKTRFPVWMWRNEVVRDFVEWLRTENLRREVATTKSFYSTLPVALFGLDIYSMFTSSDQVIAYLDAVDPPMAARARQHYEQLQASLQSEVNNRNATERGLVSQQSSKIRRMLEELDGKSTKYKQLFSEGDDLFDAHENARVVVAAEEHFRQSYLGDGRELSWNVRDHAMADMIVNALALHDEKLAAMHTDDKKRGRNDDKSGDVQSPPQARAVVWAHNSHIGDAAATDQYERSGQVNVGHLVRQALGEDNCFLIGQVTNAGNVRAAQRWNGRGTVMDMDAALPDSVGALLHEASVAKPQMRDFGLIFRRNAATPTSESASTSDRESERAHGERSSIEAAARAELAKKRPERFVGAQYAKQDENEAHYSLCSVSRQFDALVYHDKTTALRPLPDGDKTP